MQLRQDLTGTEASLKQLESAVQKMREVCDKNPDLGKLDASNSVETRI